MSNPAIIIFSINARKNNQTLPAPVGLRTWIESLGLKNLALVSYRTITSMRVGFEYQLVREIAKRGGNDVEIMGKNLANTFDSYMVAFRSNRDTYNNLISSTGYTDDYIKNLSETNINNILKDENGWLNSLTKYERERANPIFVRYDDFYTAQYTQS